MVQRERWFLILMFGAALLALLALAAALPLMRLEPGEPFPFDLFPPVTPSAPVTGDALDLGWLRNILAALVLFVLVFIVFSAEFRRWLVRTLPAYLMLFLVLYLLLMNVRPIEPAGGAPVEQTPLSPDQTPLDALAPPVPPEIISNPPDWLISLISVALAAGLLWLAWRLLGRRSRMPAKVDQGAEIVAEARAALQSLEAGADVRDAVTRCYAEMARVLRAERGVTRAPDMTPREFEQRLARTGLGDSHIRRLTRLFEVVRYGAHTPGQREAREAEECLRAIVEAYSAPR